MQSEDRSSVVTLGISKHESRYSVAIIHDLLIYNQKKGSPHKGLTVQLSLSVMGLLIKAVFLFSIHEFFSTIAEILVEWKCTFI